MSERETSTWYTTPFGRLVARSRRSGTRNPTVREAMERLRQLNGF